jgi:hypothetical protein
MRVATCPSGVRLNAMQLFGGSAVRSTMAFVVSAALAALALRVTWEEPRAGIGILFFIGIGVGSRVWARRRIERTMRSGDLNAVLRRWGSAVETVPHPETMGPLMLATAFAAHGWVDHAREHLVRAVRGPAWEAALEHRLFLDTLLFTFEGESTQARRAVLRLERLPLPVTEATMAEQIKSLRRALAALQRAFAREADGGDTELMLEVGARSPLVHWPMRYGAAINLVHAGEASEALQLVSAAPAWPAQSYFRVFHEAIQAEVERQVVSPDPHDS